MQLSRRSSSPQAPHETLDPPPRKRVHHENFARGHKNPAKHGVLGNFDDPRVITNHKEQFRSTSEIEHNSTNLIQSHHFYWIKMFGSDFWQCKLPLRMSKWNGPRNSREAKYTHSGSSYHDCHPKTDHPNNKKLKSLSYNMSYVFGNLQRK